MKHRMMVESSYTSSDTANTDVGKTVGRSDHVLGQVLEPTALFAAARRAGGAHCRRAMETGLRHPQRERSGARVQRQRRDHAQGPRSDGDRAPADAAAGPRDLRQRPCLGRAFRALQQSARVRRQPRPRRGQVRADHRGHGQRAGVRTAAPAAGRRRLPHSSHPAPRRPDLPGRGGLAAGRAVSAPGRKSAASATASSSSPRSTACCWARRRNASPSGKPRRPWRKRSASPPVRRSWSWTGS